MVNYVTDRMNYENLDWTFAEFRRNAYKEFEKLPPEPDYLDDIIKLAVK